MQFTWHLLVAIAAILIGICLYQKGDKNPTMSPQQRKDADMYRMWSYVLWVLAAVLLIYYFMTNSKKSVGTMSHKGNMCGGSHNKGMMGNGYKAQMCGQKSDW